MKLTIELVPQTAWYSNVRSNVTRGEWDKIKKESYQKADHKCEVCGDVGTNQGFRHKIECHEIWDYNDETHKQTLTGMVSLCPRCHSTKHYGLAQIKGKEKEVKKHLMTVNQIDKDEAEKYVEESFMVWEERSKFEWELDISYLNEKD
jgi:5-methylcytosine-specific restriction endonuclease McrA